MLEKPLKKINELEEGDGRKLLMVLIRQFSKDCCYLLGADATEEAMITLIDEGLIRICTDNENYWLEVYDIETGTYKKPGFGSLT